jgi:hypothetical protein
VEILEIVLPGTANLDRLRRHSAERCRTYQSSTSVRFLQRESGQLYAESIRRLCGRMTYQIPWDMLTTHFR